MSLPQPPSFNDPFPQMGTETLRQREQTLHSDSKGDNVSPESMSTQPLPPTRPEGFRSLRDLPAISVTQNLLQAACERKKMSSSGTKKQMVDRLSKIGVDLVVDVRNLASIFLKEGVDNEVVASTKSKSPNWTNHERARLCHVVADPLHETAIGKLYNKADSRADLDRARHDAWSAEFADLFNDHTYSPTTPEGRDRVTDDLLSQFDPNTHPHKRTGVFLKSRWNKLRSRYTVAREKFTRSGQGEHDVFDLFTDGDDALAYMHCVFYELPSLDAIVRALPEGSGVEAGIEEISEARAIENYSRSAKKRKLSDSSDISKGLSDIAKAMTVPVEVNISNKKDINVTGKFNEFDISDRMAGTVNKLMELEATIRSSIRSAVLDGEEEYAEDLRQRLLTVQQRINRALAD